MANFNLSDNSLASLASDMSTRNMGRLISAIKATLIRAHREHPMREGVTGDEAKRRAEFLVQFAKEMWNDCNWTTQRIIDHLWDALDAKLSSRVWVPNDRAFYPVPGASGALN